MNHADVPAALDLVVEEVDKESQRIRDAGSAALKEGKLKPAKKAIAYAEKLAAFVKKVRALGNEWKTLQVEIDGATPEVKAIVLPRKPQKEHKTGYSRTVESMGPRTNFTVTFPDGTVITEKKAGLVLAKALEHLGPEKVASLGIVVGGEPLITQDKTLYKKYPSEVVSLAHGWFVLTHSNTKAKIRWVKQAAQALKVKVKIAE